MLSAFKQVNVRKYKHKTENTFTHVLILKRSNRISSKITQGKTNM